MPCTSTIRPSAATTLPFSAMYDSSPPARSANMARRVAYWRPDAGTNSTPRARSRSSTPQNSSGMRLCSSSSVPSMSATTSRMSRGPAMAAQSVAVIWVLSERMAGIRRNYLLRMLVAVMSAQIRCAVSASGPGAGAMNASR